MSIDQAPSLCKALFDVDWTWTVDAVASTLSSLGWTLQKVRPQIDVAGSLDQLSGILGRESLERFKLQAAEASRDRKSLPDDSDERWQYDTGTGLSAMMYVNAGLCTGVEVNLETYSEDDKPGDYFMSEVEYGDKADEFYEMFQSTTSDVARMLGSPAFSDGCEATGFPADQNALWLSLWPTPTARLMIQYKHEAEWRPFRICVVVMSKVERGRRSLTTGAFQHQMRHGVSEEKTSW